MAAPDVQREGEYEARLRQARLASSRASDAAAEENRERLAGARPSDEAARQNIARFAGGSGDDTVGPTAWRPPPPVAPPRAEAPRTGGGAADQRALETRLNLARRASQALGKSGGGGLSARQAMSMAKATPVTAIAGTAAQALSGKLSTSDVQRGIGRGCVMNMWSALWPTLGHSIYPLSIAFFIAWSSRYARKYLPQIGEEWLPAPLISKIPKAALVPLKMAELVGVLFILFWTLMLDLACLGLLALVMAVLIAAAQAVS